MASLGHNKLKSWTQDAPNHLNPTYIELAWGLGYLNIKMWFYHYRNSHSKMRWAHDHLIIIMEIHMCGKTVFISNWGQVIFAIIYRVGQWILPTHCWGFPGSRQHSNIHVIIETAQMYVLITVWIRSLKWWCTITWNGMGMIKHDQNRFHARNTVVFLALNLFWSCFIFTILQ